MDFQRLRVAWNVKACHEAEGNPKMAVRILNISVDFFLFVPYLFRLVSTELKDQTLSCQTLFSLLGSSRCNSSPSSTHVRSFQRKGVAVHCSTM